MGELVCDVLEVASAEQPGELEYVLVADRNAGEHTVVRADEGEAR